MNADPDPALKINVDPDPALKMNADPDPVIVKKQNCFQRQIKFLLMKVKSHLPSFFLSITSTGTVHCFFIIMPIICLLATFFPLLSLFIVGPRMWIQIQNTEPLSIFVLISAKSSGTNMRKIPDDKVDRIIGLVGYGYRV
jgi:hypothetical protein